MEKIKVHNISKLPVIDFEEIQELQEDFKHDAPEKNKKLQNRIIEVGFKFPAFVWSDNGVFYSVDSHQRLKALRELKKAYKIPKIPYLEIQAKNKDEAKKEILYLNSRYATINPDSQFIEDVFIEIEDVNIEIEELSFEVEEIEIDNNESVKLVDKFIIPPFSILDTRQGYWQERKRYWKELIGDNGESREELIGSGGLIIDKKSNSWLSNPKKGCGVSLLDPVLAEITNQWFGLPNCKTFDCFAGDSVFGYVSDAVGNTFTGIELRQEQADLNNQRLKGSKSKYICDDGQNILKHIKKNSQDLFFTCPPYFDLEVYSNLQNDASNQKEYKDFIKILDNAFTDSMKCLKDNRFAVITVGDIRDKKGFYYRFVDDIKDIFKKSNIFLYNELILTEVIAFGAIRASKNMDNRKITKCHQNVLVFYKGDPKEIKNIYPKLDFSQLNESTDI